METKTEDQMGSYVMSVLTGTLTGRRMDTDEVADQVVDNGWMAGTDADRAAVEEKLAELVGQGWVDRTNATFALSQKAVASLFGED